MSNAWHMVWTSTTLDHDTSITGKAVNFIRFFTTNSYNAKLRQARSSLLCQEGQYAARDG